MGQDLHDRKEEDLGKPPVYQKYSELEESDLVSSRNFKEASVGGAGWVRGK